MAAPCAVLVVDDDEHIREVMAEMLSAEGFVVRTAANGREALALLQQWHPDLILLDLDMPEMDGRVFRVEQLRSTDLARIPVIVMSAASSLQAMAAALEATEALPKPCDLEVVVRAIRRVTDG